MSTQQNPPSELQSNPSDYDSILGVFRIALKKYLQATDNKLPAQVIAYNRVTNRAQVQPLILAVTTLGNTLIRAQIASVPVLQLGGGGMIASFNLVAGDLGWIEANDRDISLFKQAYAAQPPNTKRLHSFEDAMFVPDVMTGYTIATEDSGNAVLQNKAGTVCLSIWPGQIKATTPNMGITDTRAYAPNANAVLDVQSTTKAFKVPSMTTAQRDEIPSPVGGFIVYVNDFTPNPKFSFYTDGVGWS